MPKKEGFDHQAVSVGHASQYMSRHVLHVTRLRQLQVSSGEGKDKCSKSSKMQHFFAWNFHHLHEGTHGKQCSSVVFFFVFFQAWHGQQADTYPSTWGEIGGGRMHWRAQSRMAFGWRGGQGSGQGWEERQDGAIRAKQR